MRTINFLFPYLTLLLFSAPLPAAAAGTYFYVKLEAGIEGREGRRVCESRVFLQDGGSAEICRRPAADGGTDTITLTAKRTDSTQTQTHITVKTETTFPGRETQTRTHEIVAYKSETASMEMSEVERTGAVIERDWIKVNVFPAPDCFSGGYDLGPQAAALILDCEDGSEAARLYFCRRQTLLDSGRCTGQGEPVSCRWSHEISAWACEEKGNYPFQAELRRTLGDTISYKFRSSFNEGELSGRRIPSGR